ncbi:MAG TPA: hypothetical protein VGG51_04290 [Candidatus Cybelea sp.]
MKLQRLPAALALGVPASLIAHGLLFGADHELGGPFHGAIVSLALAVTSSFVAFFAALAWRGGRAADGSVLATRLQACLPGSGTIFVSAALFFSLCESLEAAHAARGIPVTLAVLALASWVIGKLACAVVRAIADAVIAIAQVESASRAPQFCVRDAQEPLPRRTPATRRHLARPPPTVALLRA